MLSRKTYFIREHVGVFKLSDTYDILDPETHEQLGIAKEKPGTLVHVLRFLVEKEFSQRKFSSMKGLIMMIHQSYCFLFKGASHSLDQRWIYVMPME